MNFRKIISYIVPLRKYYESEVSGSLEVAWVDGKKLLDSKNSNYSYGSAGKILDLGLEKIDIEFISHVLVLGLGGGSVIHSLRHKFKYRGQITAVENDPVVIELAKNEFGIGEDDSLRIVRDDAFKFVKKRHESYDLIVVDLFVDQYACAGCYTNDFWLSVYKHLTDKGSFIFNAGISVENDKRIEDLSGFLSSCFAIQIFHKAARLNTLIVGDKRIAGQMKNRKALLVIDMQKGSFTPETPRYDAMGVIERINVIAKILREFGQPVIFIQHDGSRENAFIPQTDEWELLPGLEVLQSDLIISKTANDAFYRSDLKLKLDELDVNELLITGCATDFCVGATIQSALTNDFAVTVIKDGHTTGERPHLKAEKVIEHYNWIWQNMIPTGGKIEVRDFEEVKKDLKRFR